MLRTNVLGVDVHHVTYDTAIAEVIGLASRRSGGLVGFCNVHMAMTAYRDPEFRGRVNSFDVLAPDGQPIRWAVNLLGDAGLRDRVYGPETMLRACAAAQDRNLGIYLYGSYPVRVRRLATRLTTLYPKLRIEGLRPSRFRPATPKEDEDDVREINGSGAEILFVGLGCPRQENWAFEHRHSIQAVQLCVGGAFDFISGEVPQAPPVLQRIGLEWAFRLAMEPKRLWPRYATTNPAFLALLAKQLLGCKVIKEDFDRERQA